MITDIAAVSLSIATFFAQLSDIKQIEQLKDDLTDKKAEITRKDKQLDDIHHGLHVSETEASGEFVIELPYNVLNHGGPKNESVKHANEVLKADIAKLSSAQQGARADQEADHEAAVKQMQRKNEGLLNEVQKLQRTVVNLEKKIKETDEEKAYIDSKAKAQDEELLGYDEKIEEARVARDEATKETARLRKMLEKEETERQLADNKVKSLEETLEDSASQIRDCKSLLATRTKEVETLSDDIASLRDELRAAKETNSLLHHPVGIVNVNELGGEWATVDASVTTIPPVQGEADVIQGKAPDVDRLSDGKLRRPPKPSLPIRSQTVSIPTEAILENSKTTVEQLKKAIVEMGEVPGRKFLKAELVKQAVALARKKRGEAEPELEADK